MSTVAELKEQIKVLRKKRDTDVLSASQRQLVTDEINELKRQISEMTTPDRRIVPSIGVSTVTERKVPKKKSSIRIDKAYL